jgi:hypothetical protein
MIVCKDYTLTLHTCVTVSEEHVAVAGTDTESESWNF